MSILQSFDLFSNSKGWPIIFLPLIVIVIISGTKDLIEDKKRKKSDDIENNQLMKVLKDEKFVSVKWENIRVGNIIKVIIFTSKILFYSISFFKLIFLNSLKITKFNFKKINFVC